MSRVTILSPHRDDAIFSLSIALSRWSKAGVALRVVNIFTISEYAPRAVSPRASSVSSIRSREDRAALSAIDQRLRVESLEWLDAPLRLQIELSAISRPETMQLQSKEEVEALARHFRKYFAQDLVLAPLGLGDHVDHRVVNEAALACSSNAQLAFYEDLPYAAWTPESGLRAKVAELQRTMSASLAPLVIRTAACGVTRKLSSVSRYRSQITRAEGATIARYALRYRSGERIWIPKSSASWRELAG